MGGHVWVFFKEAYPAAKSRKIIISLLQQSDLLSIFDKNSSFDRLFPNQDFLSGKGLDNLIALPLYKPALDNGNSCFVDPFSFVFLLKGDRQFHIMLETLDTEEATHIWHTRLAFHDVIKNKRLIFDFRRKVDQDLNVIRNKGRQIFLTNPPENFSKIQHDYSDDLKGFVIWKDQVEERLI